MNSSKCALRSGVKVRRAAAALGGLAVAMGAGQSADAAILMPSASPLTAKVSNPFDFQQAIPSLVTPLDTFSIAVVGFNNTTEDGTYLTNTEDPVFGTTNAYPSAALGGQTLTVSSSESVGLTNTVDTITISVPTAFVPAGQTFNGSGGTGEKYNFIEVDLGEFNGGTDMLSFALPISTPTMSGVMNYGTSSVLNLTPTATLGSGNTTLAAYEAVSAGTSDLGTFAINKFTMVAIYPTAVPEPTSLSLLATGGLLLARRRRSI